ncbi:Rad50/sbcC double strand break DNA repair processing nuclease, meiosis and mitosis [Guillardia theta CCMP2712]|uniref:Rad50/sbcC double strand break DNA repair processing nuclease, meiosis and mitosis n=2 Tax=Guillardia theta TaxID=55529 RepID=L1J1X1_GUITC|nr:Rad50/sbcC double strand break DNA repair processing nuclease, meiosis and mitosis [Guillardia theta CCMP2712]EKX42277.1 Rad50/sbcC double strand break DNA repair processing nuclease, meiosis and mitosis [Guillardia theta CCMP2712]|eukprot:XP_005829257.1 Rad50/sbcC double strand break DNA repair processing nuclease, meiosis and mitosis [Guillardia theta CCMP2712]
MTTVDKLLIQGIRSYGPDDRDKQTIQFGCPLTLILGKNGSGKTTIIECLRMITSGALPPHASSGQSFIHDPRASNRTKTSSLIRMRFSRLNGEQVTVKQTFELANKSEQKQQYRKVSSEIEIKSANKEAESMNRKCGDDNVVPIMMGVTKALLQHVIFCHQEESNWILGDSRSIKEKFDAIFASTKYAKALESIRKTQQETKTELKEIHERVNRLRTNRDHAKQQRENLQNYQQRSEEGKRQIEMHEKNCKNAEQELQNLSNTIDEYADKETQVKSLEGRLETLEKFKAQAEADVKQEFTEDVNTLESLLADLKVQDRDCQESFENLVNEENDVKGKLNDCQENISRLKNDKSNLIRDKQLLETKKEERLKFCKDIASEYSLDKTDVNEVGISIESSFSRVFGDAINAQQSQHQIDLEKKKAYFLECHKIISHLQYKTKSNADLQDRKKEVMDDAEKQIKILNEKQSLLSSNDKMWEEREVEITKVQQELDELKESGGQERFTRRIDEFRGEKENKKLEMEQIEAELNRRRCEHDEYISWKHKQRDYESRLAKANEILAQNDRKFQEIMKFRPDLESLQNANDIATLSQESRRNMDRIKNEMFQHQQTLETSDSNLRKVSSEMDELKKSCEDLRNRSQESAVKGGATRESMLGSDVDANLERLTKSLNNDKEILNQQCVANRSLKSLVETFEKFASEHHKCPICAKQVESERQLEKIKSKCASLQADVTPEVLKKLEEQIMEVDKKIGHVAHACELRQELKGLEAQLLEKSKEAEELSAIKASAIDSQEALTKRKQEAEEHDEKVNQLTSILDEMDLKSLARMKSELSDSKVSDTAQDDGQNSSYESLIARKKELQDACIELDTKIDALFKEREVCQEKENSLQKKVSLFSSEKEKFDQTKLQNQRELEGFKKQKENAIIEIQKAQKDQVHDEKLLSEKEAEKKNLQKEIDSLQNENDSKLHSMKEKLFQLKSFDSEIYNSSRSSLDKAIRDVEGRIKEEEKKQKERDAEGIRGCESELRKSEYQDIDKIYALELVKLNAKRIAEQDLDKSYKALDRALVKFHTLKMEQINQSLKEFWQNTYRGDDIAYIEIKTDVDESNNRRTHNYRLVMKCLDAVELDMRGRCSAGQKVLASLVVRLALAETFCHNCGILALDEPTSNLDAKNIEGFTDALSRLVNERKAESDTFQLIVISHDMEFIENLAFKTGTTHYMRFVIFFMVNSEL